MYCVYCGAKAPDDAAFCGSCGRRIGSGPSSAPPPPIVAPTAYTDPYAALFPAPGPHASFGRRLGGYLIDGVVELCIGFAIGFVFGIAVFAAGGDDKDLEDQTVLLQLIAGSAGFLYIWLMSISGATVGMRALGMRIVPDNGTAKPSVGQALVRTIVFYIGGFILGLGYLWMLWDSDEKTWHDHASDSTVVYRG